MTDMNYTYYEAAEEAIFRGADPFFKDRLKSMIYHVTKSTHSISMVTDLRVAKGWPSRGTIRFTRVDDGQRFKAYLRGKKFKVVKVA